MIICLTIYSVIDNEETWYSNVFEVFIITTKGEKAGVETEAVKAG